MGKMQVPSAPPKQTTFYKNLKGVDFSRDTSETSSYRTQTGLNMISEEGGNPVKRIGWRILENLDCGEILNIYPFSDGVTGWLGNTADLQAFSSSNISSTKAIIVGTQKTYLFLGKNATNKFMPLYEGTQKVTPYFFNDKIYLIIGKTWKELRYYYERTSTGLTTSQYIFEDVTDFYSPEVIISKKPDGTGGQTLEPINMLSTRRTYSFLGDDTSTTFKLGLTGTYTNINQNIKVEELTEQGWIVVTDYTTTPAIGYGGEQCIAPQITFTSPKSPLVEGQDNIRITFSPQKPPVIPYGVFPKTPWINTVDFATTYGYASSDRVFLSQKGSNRVYYSDVNEPLYFPDTNYFTVGHDSSGVMGMTRAGDKLAIVKQNSETDSSVYLVEGAYFDNKMYFKAQPTSAKIGAISQKCFDTLLDEPLYMSEDGIIAIANSYATTEKIIKNRSYMVDKKLLREKNLDKACGTVWEKYYILCVNNKCYVLDGRHKVQDSRNNSDFVYESYYWENVPASAMGVLDGQLYFGTTDGKLCVFNSDIDNDTKYSDGGTLVNGSIEGGKAIVCEWSTPLDDDGIPHYFKSLSKKGTLLTLLPYNKTSAIITLNKDGQTEIKLPKFIIDNTGSKPWIVIDFQNFDFTSVSTTDYFFKKKYNKYKRLQIIVRNDGLYEPFGIINITKTYTVKGYSKNRGY